MTPGSRKRDEAIKQAISEMQEKYGNLTLIEGGISSDIAGQIFFSFEEVRGLQLDLFIGQDDNIYWGDTRA